MTHRERIAFIVSVVLAGILLVVLLGKKPAPVVLNTKTIDSLTAVSAAQAARITAMADTVTALRASVRRGTRSWARQDSLLDQQLDSAERVVQNQAATIDEVRGALSTTIVTVRIYQDSTQLLVTRYAQLETSSSRLVDSLMAASVTDKNTIKLQADDIATLTERTECTWLFGLFNCPSRKQAAVLSTAGTVIIVLLIL